MERHSLSRWLKKLAKKHNLRQARQLINDERLTWLERDQVPEGFELELPEPLKLFKLRPKPGSYSPTVSGPLEPGSWDILSAEYQKAVEKYAAEGEWGSLGQHENGVFKVIERERSRYQRAYDEYARKARSVLNAWIFLAIKDFDESFPPKDQEFARLGIDRANMLWRWRQGPGKHVTENRREEQKLWAIQELKKQYGPAKLFYYEAHRFWYQLSRHPVLSANVDPVEQVLADFQALCKGFFSTPPELRQSFTDGLAHYRKQMALLSDSLVLLECKRVAHEIIQHDLVFNQQPPNWEELTKEPPYEDESMQTTAEAPFSANAVWYRWGRFIINRVWELEHNEGVKERAEQARRISELLGEERQEELERFCVDGGGFSSKQLKRVIDFHHDTGFDAS